MSLPSPASAKLTGTAWGELPHFCSGLHNVPDTPDILIGLLNDDHTCRARAVWNLYRLLLNQERVFPATAPAALVVAALLGDPRMLAGGRWERRAGRRPVRVDLLNWLASFADVARLGAEDGAGAPQDLAAARAARPTLHTHVAAFCEDDDPQVREAAVAATALLLADPALASSTPRYVPVVREVLARSADSYYRWIARERLESWGEDTTVLITAEGKYRAAVDRAHALAGDPFDESQGQAIRWLAEQPEDTAALDPPGRWHPDWAAPQRAAPHEPAPEPPTAVPASAPGYRGPWLIAGGEGRDEWTFTPYVGVGPLHFGMTLEEITAALGEEGSVSSSYAPGSDERRLDYADFRTAGVRALFRTDRLECVAVDALTGPQVRLGGVPLTGCVPSRLEDRLLHRAAHGRLMYSPAADPLFPDLGLAIRSQRAGDVNLTRPLFLLHDWLDLWHSLPSEEWNSR
ncbi:hypothetical protein OG618_35690 [Kitasatospora sp. NBC_01246]|uniref:hypothetical protein n=1 Tax=Kitasatospora sp. NBC_01246 TaxID=2903570 RepID=UPI002E34B827|nr:hypothetical protein [Kitasatospora sp. NBC_01246]